MGTPLIPRKNVNKLDLNAFAPCYQFRICYALSCRDLLIDEKFNFHLFHSQLGVFKADGDSPLPTAALGILLIVFLISELSSKPLNKLVTLICLQFNWKIKQICRINLLLNSIGGTREILSWDFYRIFIALRKEKGTNCEALVQGPVRMYPSKEKKSDFGFLGLTLKSQGHYEKDKIR